MREYLLYDLTHWALEVQGDERRLTSREICRLAAHLLLCGWVRQGEREAEPAEEHTEKISEILTKAAIQARSGQLEDLSKYLNEHADEYDLCPEHDIPVREDSPADEEDVDECAALAEASLVLAEQWLLAGDTNNALLSVREAKNEIVKLRAKVAKLEVERDALGEQYYDAEDKLRQQMRGVREMVEKERDESDRKRQSEKDEIRLAAYQGIGFCTRRLLVAFDRITGDSHESS